MKYFCCMCILIERQYEAHQIEIFCTLMFSRFQASESQAPQRVDHRPPTPVPSLRRVASSSESGFISQFIFRLFDAVVDPFSRQAAGARGIDQCQLANGAALSTLLEHPPRHRQPLPATSHRGRSGVCPFIQSRMYFALSSSRVVHSSLALYTALSKYHLNVVIFQHMVSLKVRAHGVGVLQKSKPPGSF